MISTVKASSTPLNPRLPLIIPVYRVQMFLTAIFHGQEIRTATYLFCAALDNSLHAALNYFVQRTMKRAAKD